MRHHTAAKFTSEQHVHLPNNNAVGQRLAEFSVVLRGSDAQRSVSVACLLPSRRTCTSQLTVDSGVRKIQIRSTP